MRWKLSKKSFFDIEKGEKVADFLNAQSHRLSGNWYTSKFIQPDAVIKLRHWLNMTFLIDFNEVILEHIDEVLEAEDGITCTFSCYNVENCFIYTLNEVL